jgi:hypothetical protein
MRLKASSQSSRRVMSPVSQTSAGAAVKVHCCADSYSIGAEICDLRHYKPSRVGVTVTPLWTSWNFTNSCGISTQSTSGGTFAGCGDGFCAARPYWRFGPLSCWRISATRGTDRSEGPVLCTHEFSRDWQPATMAGPGAQAKAWPLLTRRMQWRVAAFRWCWRTEHRFLLPSEAAKGVY